MAYSKLLMLLRKLMTRCKKVISCHISLSINTVYKFLFALSQSTKLSNEFFFRPFKPDITNFNKKLLPTIISRCIQSMKTESCGSSKYMLCLNEPISGKNIFKMSRECSLRRWRLFCFKEKAFVTKAMCIRCDLFSYILKHKKHFFD